MLKLINIVQNNNFMEADYIPENSTTKGHVTLNVITKESHADLVENYGSMYGRMAINGLRNTLDELNKGKISEISKERVMWY